MKIALLVAMDKEMQLLIPLLEERTDGDIDGMPVHYGRIGRHAIALARCGIGKVNAAVNTYRVISAFSPELVINSGVAGGAGGGARIGDLLVADYVAYHDVWCGPGTATGAADGLEVFIPADGALISRAHEMLGDEGTVYGLICSGDRFIASAQEVRNIRHDFPAVKAIDMESAAIAQVCAMKRVPFNILRVISDTPGEGENIEQYTDFWAKAPATTFAALKMLLS